MTACRCTARRVTNIIDGLEKSGFVTREPHERDRRTTLAAITRQRPPDGRRSDHESSTPCTSARDPLQPPELDAITSTLETLRAAADGFPPERGESLRRDAR